jgi:hypothetical protein
MVKNELRADILITPEVRAESAADTGDLVLLKRNANDQLEIGYANFPLYIKAVKSADPSLSLAAGQIYYNSSTNQFRWYNGTVWDDFGGGGGGANVFLSNLTSPTAINQDLIFDTGVSAFLQTKAVTSGYSQNLNVKSGDAVPGLGTGALVLSSGDGQISGAASLLTGISSAAPSGNILIQTGTTTGASPSGSVTISTGTSSTVSGDLNLYTGAGSAGAINIKPGTVGGTGTINLDANQVMLYCSLLAASSDSYDIGGSGNTFRAGYFEKLHFSTGGSPSGHLECGTIFSPSGSATEVAFRSQSVGGGGLSVFTNSGAGGTGNLYLETGNDASSGYFTGNINIQSGSISGVGGTTGNIQLVTGTVSAGTRGSIYSTSRDFSFTADFSGTLQAPEVVLYATTDIQINSPLVKPAITMTTDLGSDTLMFNRLFVGQVHNSVGTYMDYVDLANNSLVYGGAISVDWQNYYLKDSTANISLAWNARTLVNADGSTVMVDWSTASVKFPAEIGSSFIPDAASTWDLGTSIKPWGYLYSRYVSIIEGGVQRLYINAVNSTPSGVTTALQLQGTSALWTDPIALTTSSAVSGVKTGDVLLESGNSNNDSGHIILTVGTATGVRGSITFRDGTEGTAGYVWTAQDATGKGAWAAVGAGSFANQQLSNLSGTVAINLDLIFDKGSAAFVKTKDGNGTQALTVQTGNDGGGFSSGNILVTSGSTAASGQTGDAWFSSGTPSSSGNSGAVQVFSGGVTSGASGQATLYTGAASSSGSSGLIQIFTGDTASATSGAVSISSGNAGSGNTGAFNIYTGSSSSGGTGVLNLASGSVNSSSPSGNVTINTGAQAGSGDSGLFNFSTGTTGNGNTGAVNIFSGNTTGTGASGLVSIRGGNATASGGTVSGVEVRGGDNLVDGTGGFLNFYGGEGVAGGGGINISTGGSSGGSSGGFALDTQGGGVAVNFNSGGITAISGNVTGTGNTSGSFLLKSGTSVAGDTGAFQISTGNSSSGGSTGNVLISTGTTSGVRGNIQLQNGSEGTLGQVWLSTDAFGSGVWSPVPNQSAWKKYTVSYAALSAAALTNDIELFSLPAKHTIHGVVIKHNTPFTGGAISAYTLSVGVVSNLAKFSTAFDVFQAAASNVMQDSANLDTEDIASSTSIRLAAISVGANLDQATAGSVDIYVQLSDLDNADIVVPGSEEELYFDALVLTANTSTSPSQLQYLTASYGAHEIRYYMVQATTGESRQGTFRVVSNDIAQTVSINDMSTQTASVSITASATCSAGTVTVTFANADLTNNVTMRAYVRRFRT